MSNLRLSLAITASAGLMLGASPALAQVLLNLNITTSFVILFIVASLVTYTSPATLPMLIFALRKNHPNEIYVIWLFFSFFLAVSSNVALEDVFGAERREIVAYVLKYLIDGETEITIVLAIVSLVVLPQWMTYILSGVFGVASPPLFVSQITRLAIWSVVKFSAALAGVVLASLTAHLTMGSRLETYKFLEGLGFLAFLSAGGLLSMAFFLVWIYSAARRTVEFVYQVNALSWLRHIHRFFTRYSRHEAKLSDDSPA
jgi:hypothetical protein